MRENNQHQTTVSTFLEEDTLDMIYDGEKLDKWHSMVEELGLQGQTKVATKEKSPIPFLYMNKGLTKTIETLCPRKVLVEEYSASPIPVEILDLISLSKREGYFERIRIFYDDVTPDPAAVGSVFAAYYSQNNSGNLKTKFQTKQEAKDHMISEGWNEKEPYPTDEQLYLIGKWGDIKMSIEDMRLKAIKRYISENSVECQKRIKEYERKLADIEIDATEFFGEYSSSLPF
jgi:hypothetical protein